MGQCKIEEDRILKVVDKDQIVNLSILGVIAWRGRYSKYINDNDHIGYSINPAIEDGAVVGYVNSDSEYYDCGTIDEYWKLLEILTISLQISLKALQQKKQILT